MVTPIAAAYDVVKRFGDLTAVAGVSLEVARGEVVGLLGANGAGKTTLIRMLLGVLAPTAGSVHLFGRPPSRSSLRRVGYVPQGLGLYTDLTVNQNLAFRAGLFEVEMPALEGDLGRVGDVAVGRLPLGAQRRVAFVAALVHRPDLLMLDEPTSGVGPLGRARLWDTIRTAAEEEAGVLVTTHHMEEAEQCDRLVMMADGRVVEEGTLDEVVGERRAVEVAVDDWERALEVLEEAGWPVRLAGSRLRVVGVGAWRVESALNEAGLTAEVHQVPGTLDETFVALTRS
jgi:ABC-2 type transport system ATP-binding protein/ribosome-dependent ATPase